MGVWSRMFRKNSRPQGKSGFQLVTEIGNGFYSWHGELYKSDIIRSCIRPKAKAIGKLLAKHIRESAGVLQVNPEPFMRFLLEEPNPFMSGQMFQEKLATQLDLNNNAFALIYRDPFGTPKEIYPIPCTVVEAVYVNKELNLKFTLRNGETYTFPYKDIIHLRQDFHQNDIFGDSPAEAITDLMEVVTTNDQGIVKAIKNSNAIKWLLKFQNVLRDDDVKAHVDKFVQNYLSIDSDTGGAAAADAKYDIQQVKPESYVPEANITKQTLQRIYGFFGTNEKIVQSNYTEDDWVAYYEAQIEPLSLQMSNEFTRKLFSRKERSFGNKIIFEASNLQYASMSTKLGLVQMVDRGAMTPNEWRRILNMGPLEGGDQPIRRLDTATVEGGEDNTENTSQGNNRVK